MADEININAERNNNVLVTKLVVAALLIAIGILIPMIMPKVYIEPMSFTLASHVAIFLAMFISTDVAIAVVIGTTIGFFVAFPNPVIAARALSHIVFATLGGLYLKHHPGTVHSPVKFHIFSFVIALIHAACEVITVFAYYVFVGGLTGFTGTVGFKVLFLLVGLGTAVHSMVDFEIAGGIYQVLNKNKSFSLIFSNVHVPKTDKNNRLVSK